MCIAKTLSYVLGGVIPGLGVSKMQSDAKAAQEAMTPPPVTPLPTPAPLPTISPTKVSIQDNQSAARNRLRYGLSSTIKSMPQGTASLLNTTGTGAKTLG